MNTLTFGHIQKMMRIQYSIEFNTLMKNVFKIKKITKMVIIKRSNNIIGCTLMIGTILAIYTGHIFFALICIYYINSHSNFKQTKKIIIEE